jgi:hypothetical protein
MPIIAEDQEIRVFGNYHMIALFQKLNKPSFTEIGAPLQIGKCKL